MDQKTPEIDKHRPNDEREQNEKASVVVTTTTTTTTDTVIATAAAAVVATTPRIQQTADIFKLDIDCFDETFDYLPLKDLISVGKTCKRLQQVAGYCFSQNYPHVQIASNSKGFQVVRNDMSMNVVTHFAPFIREIDIVGRDDLQYLLNIKSKLRRLKKIEICYIGITQPEVDRMQEVFAMVEVLRITGCELNQAIIASCPKLRCLKVSDRCTDYNWLAQKYPTLERFEFIPHERGTESIREIVRFFELNPNVRKFATTAEYLWANRDRIKRSNCVQLDDLSISFDWNTQVDIVPFCELLNELHERKVYRRFHLSFSKKLNQEVVNELATVKGFVKLFIHSIENNVKLNLLISLEDLSVHASDQITDIESVAHDLINLRRIYFSHARWEDIVPFIRRSTELKHFGIDFLKDGTHFSRYTNVIDLLALNREREELPDAEKITLCVDEEIFLATKWTLKETNFNLIRLRRLEAFQLDFEFTC